MTKIFAMMLIAVFALTGCTTQPTAPVPTQPAVETEEPFMLEETAAAEEVVISGTVLEITDAYIVFTGVDGQVYQANITEETIQEYDLNGDLAVGDYIYVMYDGKMTRSIPAQITAQLIRSSVREGVVGEVTGDSFMLKTDLEEIQVNCTAEQLEGIQSGMQVKVYFSGAMTMSLPAQIGADLIIVLE